MKSLSASLSLSVGRKGQQMSGLVEDFEKIIRPIDPETGEQIPAATIDVGITNDTAIKLFLGALILINSPKILSGFKKKRK